MDFSGPRLSPPKTRNEVKTVKTTSKAKIIAGASVLALLLAIAVFLLILNLRAPGLAIPQHINNSLSFPLYLPNKLPGSYQLRQESFSVQEERVFVFQATDSANSKLSFSEQAKPANMNFDEFYANNMKGAKTLDAVAHPTVWGKTLNDKATLISVVIGDTWILVSTDAPLDEADVSLIAKNLIRR